MEHREVDVAIIGAGTAGLSARREVEKAGKSYVLIEAGPYGTTCARVGCMPSKLLIAAAEAAHAIESAPRFGVHASALRVDGREVMARVKRERDRFVGFVVAGTESIDAAHRLRGRARFVEPGVLRVDEHTQVAAKAVVIATGSAPFVPPPYRELGERLVINDDVFEWDDLPESVAVIGTGIIGLELGQALRRLGVEVAFFNPTESLGPFTDPAIRAVVRDSLSAELDLHLGVEGLSPSLAADAAVLRWQEKGESHERRFEKVLVAAGRRANLGSLELAASGLTLDERGRPKVNYLTCQAEESSVFFAGDVNAHRPLLHEASDEGHIAGANAARFPEVVAHVRRVPLAIAFTDPQMAMVGASLAELDPDEIAIGEVSYADQGRARVMGMAQGLVRIYARRACCTILGAEMFGPRMEHMAQLLANAVHARQTVPAMLEMPFYHPVLEEGLRTALRDLAKNLKVYGACRGEDVSEDCPGD